MNHLGMKQLYIWCISSLQGGVACVSNFCYGQFLSVVNVSLFILFHHSRYF